MELGAGGCMVMDRWSLRWELILAQIFIYGCVHVVELVDMW
jgi:hypothetical protein